MSQEKLSPGEIAGIVAATVGGTVLLLFCCAWLIKRHMSSAQRFNSVPSTPSKSTDIFSQSQALSVFGYFNSNPVSPRGTRRVEHNGDAPPTHYSEEDKKIAEGNDESFFDDLTKGVVHKADSPSDATSDPPPDFDPNATYDGP